MKKTLPFYFLTFYFFHSAAQNFTISGYMSDIKSGEKLIGATTFDIKNGGGTITNEYGFYSLTLPADSVILSFSYVGYTSQKIIFYLNRDTIIHIKLISNTQLQEVVISAEKNEEKIQERSQMSTIDIPIETIKALPAFLGETDVLKAMQLLPGVQGGTEGTSGIFVRGGSPDQNLILLDGVPVYNASHLFGFFSVFNSDALNKATLIKGGFPARYGGRLSSVIDLRMKEGDMDDYHGAGSIGLVASRLTVEGPIKKDTSSFIISTRRTYIDILARPIIKASSDGAVAGYFFYDVNAKFNYKFSDKDRLYLSGYFGRDKFYFNDKDYDPDNYSEGGLNWGNATGVVRWNHILNKRAFSNLTATFTSYEFEIFNNLYETDEDINGEEIQTLLGFKYFSGIRDIALKEDIDFIPSPKHFMKFGAGVIWHTFMPGATEFKQEGIDLDIPDINLSSDNISAVEGDLYAEDDWEISNSLKVNFGLHASLFAVDTSTYISLQPRISARYLVGENVSIKASYSQMTQFIHLLSNSGIGLPTDLWVPATDKVVPQNAHQYALGFAYTLQDNYEISVEGYYKKMNNIIDYKDGASYLYDGVTEWEDKVESGEGWAYGGEFFLQKRIGDFNGWIGYTLSWSNRQFPTINLGEKYPYKYDTRHNIDVAAVYNITDRITFSAVFVFSSGQPISIPVAKYIGAFGELIYHYEGRNGYRMNPYHRMDINISFHKEKKHWTRTWNFGAYNVYNHYNPFFIYEEFDPATGEGFYKQVTLFPIIPYVSWDFKF
ncbi:MAG: TonB-dependent receptor plug domain-containing protein [Chitinophagales bacterium]|nr:TonB-dependent receptor plug domain-containing protein [Chitinophagales bacterium]